MVSQTLATALVASVALAEAMPPVQQPRIAARAASNSSAYSLIADYSGSDFFNHFTPYTAPDPTHGFVVYQDLKSAAEQNLVGYIFDAATNKTSAYMGVDYTTKAPTAGRNSVRLTGKDKLNAGSMAVIDLNHIPVATGLWPAIWMLGTPPDGQTWPVAGESDILEYVHEDIDNSMTLHSAPGCTVDNATTLFQGALGNSNCNAGDKTPGTTGCSIKAVEQNTIGAKQYATAGPAFNKAAGGVYVHDWQSDGITVWLFPHADVPVDLTAGTPNPSSWNQKPLAKFSGSGCDYTKAFHDMSLIINLDFCGDWAGQVWVSSGAAAKTGVATCNEYVANNADAFKDSYFDIASVKFYSNNGQKLAKRHEDDGTTVEIPTIAKPCDTQNISMPVAKSCTKSTGNGNYTFDSTRSIVSETTLTSKASSTETMAWLVAAGQH
ncbi:glycoside hydrolase family 16 protein [Dothistroma septosporum NZE10]|uniref:Glycoside hydrolase family 16 protein n=1 Tax=Dothistroma septosporum (strain NZE10 / CBS 128990) TaxID=675120 RepID=N1PCE0_DOTSN|nr:glycoside hydrolase family 16 protein [Dothistroma septosporum NZE10]